MENLKKKKKNINFEPLLIHTLEKSERQPIVPDGVGFRD